MAQLGDSSVSSLVSSAASAVNQLNDLKVLQADANYADSTKSNGDLAAYRAVIQPLLTHYQSGTTFTDQSKATAYQQKLISAQNSNFSSQIKQAQIGIDQGSYTLADKVNLLAHLYSTASDPADQQSILAQYDTAEMSLASQNASAASSARSAVSTGYTVNNAHLGTLQAQIKASIMSGTNQIDPSLMSGSNQIWIDAKGNVSTTPVAGATAETLSIPAKGAKMTATQLVQAFGVVSTAKYMNNAQAAIDPNLTVDQQASHATSAQNDLNDLQTSPMTNPLVLQAMAKGEDALVRTYTIGTDNATFTVNPNIIGGRYVDNPTTASINKSLSALAGNTSASVKFNVKQDGILTEFHIQKIGNAYVAVDPSNQNTGQAFLWDSGKGALVPFNAQHQQAFNQAKFSSDPGQAMTNVVNQVANGYAQSQATPQKTGSALLSVKGGGVLDKTGAIGNQLGVQLINKAGEAIVPIVKGIADTGMPILSKAADEANNIAQKIVPGLGPVEQLAGKAVGDIGAEIGNLMNGGHAAAEASRIASQLPYNGPGGSVSLAQNTPSVKLAPAPVAPSVKVAPAPPTPNVVVRAAPATPNVTVRPGPTTPNVTVN